MYLLLPCIERRLRQRRASSLTVRSAHELRLLFLRPFLSANLLATPRIPRTRFITPAKISDAPNHLAIARNHLFSSPLAEVRSQQPADRNQSPPKIPSSTIDGAPSPARRGGPDPGVPENISLALGALHNLTTHCPDWAKRLDELSGQIKQRQLDLARIAEQNSSSKKSLKKRVSTESLNLKDDAETHPRAQDLKTGQQGAGSPVDTTGGGLDGVPQQEVPKACGAGSPEPKAADQQRSEARADTSKEARAALRRSELRGNKALDSNSVVTGDVAAVSKYRSKSLVIVYYDSYVQSFFEELVKFVSASRNSMRKVKMAAKVAQIKRMAELETSDDDSGPEDARLGGGNGNTAFIPPKLSPAYLRPEMAVHGVDGVGGKNVIENNADGGDKTAFGLQLNHGTRENGVDVDGNPPANPHQLSYIRANGKDKSHVAPSPRIKGSAFRPSMAYSNTFSPYESGSPPQPDVFDQLDKVLELIQSQCERAAHQFLRDGDCAEEVAKIKEKLTEANTSAQNQTERMFEQDLDGSLRKLLAEKSIKDQATRRESGLVSSAAPRARISLVAGDVAVVGQDRKTPNSAEKCAGSDGKFAGPTTSPMTIEVDEGIGDEGMGQEPPKLQFRSTRSMGWRAATGS